MFCMCYMFSTHGPIWFFISNASCSIWFSLGKNKCYNFTFCNASFLLKVALILWYYRFHISMEIVLLNLPTNCHSADTSIMFKLIKLTSYAHHAKLSHDAFKYKVKLLTLAWPTAFLITWEQIVEEEKEEG